MVHLAGLLALVHHDQANNRDDHQGQQPESRDVREDFLEGERITDLSLDVVQDKGSRIHRHGAYRKQFGIEGQRIYGAIGQAACHHDGRQQKIALIESGDDRAHLNVAKTAFTGALDGIGLPGRDHFHAVHQPLGQIRQGDLRAGLHPLQQKAVAELVGNQHRIALLELPEEGSVFRDHLAPGQERNGR